MRKFYPSPRHQKWGLFLLLTGSLGFTLSMNPDHFNHIVRNEGRLDSIELASDADRELARNQAKAQSLAAESQRLHDEAIKKKAEDALKKAMAEAQAKKASDSGEVSREDALKDGAKPDGETAPAVRTTLSRGRAAPTTASTAPAAEADDSLADTPQYVVRGNKGVFRATVFEANHVTFAKFESLSNTEGRECELCKIKAVPLSSSIDKIADLSVELQAIVDGKKDAKQTSTKPADVLARLKKGELQDDDIQEWAKKCDKASDENKLSCHKSRLIELSKILPNTSEMDEKVKEYFSTYIREDLKRAFYGRTFKEVYSESNCDGQLVVGMGHMGCRTDALENATDMADEILGGLRAANGKSVAQDLMKMRAGSFSAQMRNSQMLALEGRNENNMFKFSEGFRTLDPNTQMWNLNMANSNMLDAIQQMQGTSAQKGYLEDILGRSFYSPVSAMLNQMRNFAVNGDPANRNAPHNLTDFQIPALADDRGMIPAYPYNPSYTPGMPNNNGSMPANLWTLRSAPGRGGNLQPLANGNYFPQQQPGFPSQLPPYSSLQPNPANYRTYATQVPAPVFNSTPGLFDSRTAGGPRVR